MAVERVNQDRGSAYHREPGDLTPRITPSRTDRQQMERVVAAQSPARDNARTLWLDYRTHTPGFDPRAVLVANPLPGFDPAQVLHPNTARRQISTAAAPEEDEVASDEPLDVVAIARQLQDVRADMLASRLQKAVDVLVECKIAAAGDGAMTIKEVLFDLYEAGILTKDQVSHRGGLDPADFHEELRDYRSRQPRP